MPGRTSFQPILILALCLTEAGSKVQQMLDVTNAIAGQTVTFRCTFPLFRDINKIKVRWWKDGEKKFLDPQQDSRISFAIETKASTVLRIAKVRFEDTGVYYCQVEGEYSGNGTGKELTVTVPPAPLKISPTFFANGSLTCLCETSGFYPDSYTIVWRKDGKKVTAGVETSIKKNSKGLYKVTSYLNEPQAGPTGTVYICEVSHSTLKVPTSVNYTVQFAGTDSSWLFPWWVYLFGAIALLLMITAVVLCCKFCCCKKPKAREGNIQMRHCVRCSEPVTKNLKCNEQRVNKGNTQTPQKNVNKVEKANESSPKRKKHRKRDQYPTCA